MPGGATDRFMIRINRKSTQKMIAQGRQETPGDATDLFLIRFNSKSIQKSPKGARRRWEAQLIAPERKSYRPGVPGDAGRQ